MMKNFSWKGSLKGMPSDWWNFKDKNNVAKRAKVTSGRPRC